MRVSEIRVKQIRVNQELGVFSNGKSVHILTFVIIEEMASAYSLSTEGHKMKNERIFSTLCFA